jgi:hypothetical protein
MVGPGKNGVHSDRVVLDEANVQAMVPAELNVRP